MPASLSHDIVHGPPPPIDPGWGGDGGGGNGNDGRGSDRRASFTGLFVGLAACSVMFLALVSAFVVRRNMSDANDWVSVHKPTAMIFNTVVLVLSSLVLDFSRRALKSGHRTRFEIFWAAATALGLVFLGGQIYVWYLLKQAGIFVAGNPASSFLYLFTFIHALHVVGGVSALIWVDVQALRMRLGPSKRTAIDVWAIFWHFLDGLWLCLMVLFYVWG